MFYMCAACFKLPSNIRPVALLPYQVEVVMKQEHRLQIRIHQPGYVAAEHAGLGHINHIE